MNSLNPYKISGEEALDRDWKWLNLSVRCYNALCTLSFEVKLETVRDLCRLKKTELLKLPNFGKVSLRDVMDELGYLDLRLEHDYPETNALGPLREYGYWVGKE